MPMPVAWFRVDVYFWSRNCVLLDWMPVGINYVRRAA